MYLFCFKPYFCSVLNSILSKPRRGVSEAKEMLVTQMSNVARNEIATPLPRWKYNSNVSTNIYHNSQTFQKIFITNIPPKKGHKCQMLPGMKLQRLLLTKFLTNISNIPK